MKVHERRHQEEKTMPRKQKAEGKSHEAEHSHKKPKSEAENDNGKNNGRSTTKAAEFEEFCKATREQLSVDQMRQILEMNNQDASGLDDVVVPKCQDILFYGALDKCEICGGKLACTGDIFTCDGNYSEWSSCNFKTKDPPRKTQPVNLPESIQKSPISDLIKNRQDEVKKQPKREPGATVKPLSGLMISLSGRLSRKHQYWKSKIEKNGGKVSNSVRGVTCLVVSPAERERGGSSKVSEAIETDIPVVREAWLLDSIEKQEAQPLDAYHVLSDLAVEGRGIPWDKQDPDSEALESLVAEVKIYGKRGVHKDSKLQDEGGKILEKDGILFNCAFSMCDLGRGGTNEFCVMQLITVPDTGLYFYYKKGKVGADARAEEKVEQRENLDAAITEFAELFEELTGNEFEPWEREKKIEKKHRMFFPIDMADGVDVRHGGLGVRQLGIAATHCKLDPFVANFIKVLCSQEIYRYALMELGHDPPDLPMGMLSDVHLKRCESILLEFIEKVAASKEGGEKYRALWTDFSMKWFTLMHSTRPFIFRDYLDVAEHAASSFEAIKDITVASHLIGDMSGSTIDDPLSDRYSKLGCTVSLVEKGSDDYKMIVNYLEKTYEPLKVGEMSKVYSTISFKDYQLLASFSTGTRGKQSNSEDSERMEDYGVSVQNIFAVESSACPSYDQIKELPNKVLLWCGTRSSNLLRHLQKGFQPAVCWLPVPGYMFGKAIVCSDAAAEAAMYGFTAVDRPEGFLVLAIASLGGGEIKEYSEAPEAKEVKGLEEKKVGVLGLGRKKTDESEHFVWKDDIKVPCGRLVPSGHKDSPLEYNEYAVYNPKQVSIRYLVAVKYEEQGVVYEDKDVGDDDDAMQ